MCASLPRPWAELPADRLDDVVGVLTDIDDTLTAGGRIEAQALGALHALRSAGLPVVAVTGRPMGWSEPFARDWPVAAIVAENGAVALFRGPAGLQVDYAQDAATRARNAGRLCQVLEQIEREVPGARRAGDSAGRVTDIAIDHNEFDRLPQAAIGRVVDIMRSAGMNATVSSIHVNGWFGEHDKLSGADWIVRRLFGRELAAERDRWIYVGDSPNDQTMFGAFALSVGVANLLRFERSLTVWPAFLTRGERGAGFAEVAQSLLAQRAIRKPAG